MISENDHVHDDRAEKRQGVQHPDETPLLPGDKNDQGASEFTKLEDGHRSREGHQIAAAVGIFYSYQLH